MTALSLLSDPRMLTAALVGMLGATFLVYASPRSRPYVSWLAGSALLFGVSQLCYRGAELLGWVPIDRSGPFGAAVGLAAWAAVITGLRVHFGHGGIAPWRLFAGLAAGGCVLTLVLHRVLDGRAFASSAVVALLFALSAVWLLACWARDRWAGQLLLAGVFLLHPLLLGIALRSGLTLPQFRQLTPLPIAIGYVLVMTLIQQRDAQLLAGELAERRRAEAALQQLADSLDGMVQARTLQLEEVIQGLQSFAGMVSHDLRGPLANADSLVGLALEASTAGDGARTARWLNLLRRETHRATGMVGDLLTLASVDQGAVRRAPVAMQALVQECVQSLELMYPGAALAVQCDELPVVQADAGMLQHLMTNLLSNALKFGADRPDLAIRVRAARDGDGWRFEVDDNGPGFDTGRTADLFKPFSRLADHGANGTGLGLTVVRRVVERHGGAVGADSRPGRGAVFWWTLPAVH